MSDFDSDIQLVSLEPCPACGFRNDPDETVCGRCQVILAEHQAAPAPIVEEPFPREGLSEEPPPPPPSDTTLPGRPSTYKANTSFPIGAVIKVILLVAVGAVIAYFVLSPNYEVVGKPIGQGKPTIILMHGFGAPKDDLVPLAAELSAGIPDATFIMPAALHHKGMGRAWMVGGDADETRNQVEESRAQIVSLIGELEAEGVLAADVYVGGFSQGAQMALDVGAGPDIGKQIGGMILLSGGTGNWPNSVAVDGYSAANIADEYQILIAHGSGDRVVSIGSSEAVEKGLKEQGLSADFERFGGGHEIPPQVREAIIAFLRRH